MCIQNYKFDENKKLKRQNVQKFFGNNEQFLPFKFFYRKMRIFLLVLISVSGMENQKKKKKLV
jgi:hypothetical protein